MRYYKRQLPLLIIGIISLIMLVYLIYFSSPNTSFGISQIFQNISFPLEKFIQVPSLILFFILLALFLFSTISYIFKNKIHGTLITSFAIIYLIFRHTHLTNLFFLILLLALFVTLELFVSNKR